MGKTIDLAGRRFERWTVRSQGPRAVGGQITWICDCDCGTRGVAVLGQNLRAGRSQSCGCLFLDRVSTHGMTNSSTWASWSRMLNRCTNPNADQFPDYGGRGITVCDEWRESFENFVADMGLRPKGMTIGRRDNDGPYCRANCRWETIAEQASNKRNNRYIEFNGERLTFSQWGAKLGIHRSIIRRRFAKGWPVERILDATRWHSKGTPLAPEVLYTHKGKTRTLAEWARRTGIRSGLLAYRIKAGWPLDAVFAPKGGHYHKVRRV